MATLSATEILQDTLDAFKTMIPMLTEFSTDLSPTRAEKDQQIIAHVSSLPTAQDYDATNGFEANQTDASNLLEDVPVTLDRFRHVPVRVDYLNQLASRKNLYVEAIKNQAYVLGKDIVDFALGLVTAANFTHSTAIDTANADLGTLEDIRTELNKQKAMPVGRIGLINSVLASYIQQDNQVASADFYAQLNGANGFRRFRNIAGFNNVWEYPDMPHNNEAMIGFFCDRRAITIASRLPNVQQLSANLGIPRVSRIETITDPETGMSLMGVLWEKQGTLDVWMTIAALYGITAGAQGGSADAKADQAGHRLTTTTNES